MKNKVFFFFFLGGFFDSRCRLAEACGSWDSKLLWTCGVIPEPL